MSEERTYCRCNNSAMCEHDDELIGSLRSAEQEVTRLREQLVKEQRRCDELYAENVSLRRAP